MLNRDLNQHLFLFSPTFVQLESIFRPTFVPLSSHFRPTLVPLSPHFRPTLVSMSGSEFSNVYHVHLVCLFNNGFYQKTYLFCTGVQRFSNDIEEMLGFQPGLYWKICWAVLCPLFLFVSSCTFKVVFTYERLVVTLKLFEFSGSSPRIHNFIFVNSRFQH
jgi:hypothetical protein